MIININNDVSDKMNGTIQVVNKINIEIIYKA